MQSFIIIICVKRYQRFI